MVTVQISHGQTIMSRVNTTRRVIAKALLLGTLIIALTSNSNLFNSHYASAEESTRVASITIENIAPEFVEFQLFKVTILANEDTPVKYTSALSQSFIHTLEKGSQEEMIVLTEFNRPEEALSKREITVTEYGFGGINKGVVGQVAGGGSIHMSDYSDAPIADGTYHMSKNDRLYIGAVLGQERFLETGANATIQNGFSETDS